MSKKLTQKMISFLDGRQWADLAAAKHDFRKVFKLTKKEASELIGRWMRT